MENIPPRNPRSSRPQLRRRWRSIRATRSISEYPAPRTAARHRKLSSPGFSVQQLFQLECVRGRRALLVVVEIDENVAALLPPRPDSRRPFRKRLRAIMALVASARTMSADIDKIGGALPRRRRIMMI